LNFVIFGGLFRRNTRLTTKVQSKRMLIAPLIFFAAVFSARGQKTQNFYRQQSQ